MTLSLICGSHRNVGSYKVANFIQSRLEAKGVTVHRINLADENIPLRDESWWDKESDVTQQLQPLRDKLVESEGFVVISPERAGMAAPGLKNFFLLGSKQHEFAHKPGLLVGVSSGSGGAYPIAELRMSSYKNTKINRLPDHVIVRDIENVLNSNDIEEDQPDTRIKKRIDRSLDVLLAYTQALSGMRASTDVELMQHEFGM